MRFPLKVFTIGEATVGAGDRYRSSVLGRRFAGVPKGVYFGFVPTNTPPSPIITLVTNTSEGASLAKLPSAADPAGLDVVVTSPIQLDLTPVTTFPVSVSLRASYYEDAPPSVEVVVYPGTTIIPWNEVLLCRIDGPLAAMTIMTNPALAERYEPLALDYVPFGYMPAGSIEDLETAVDMVNEVVAARLGLDGVTYSSLSNRIAADYDSGAMGSRMGRYLSAIRSNDYVVASGASEVNVSGSFSAVNRDNAPLVTLDGAGSETTTGAVAAPNDDQRNVAIVMDALTNQRLIDTETDRNITFGRIIGPTDDVTAGTVSFITASIDVVGVGTDFTNEFQAGDLIRGDDGRYYEILLVTNATSLILRNAYVGPSATVNGPTRRRWTLRLRRLTGGVEAAATLTAQTTLRFFAPVFLDRSESVFDYRVAQLTPGVAPPLPVATTTVPGRVTLGASTSLVGAVLIQNAGVPLAGGPFHTIDFTAGNGQVIQTAPGKVTVGEIGPPGPAGPNGVSGPPGPAGPPGPGYSTINAFSLSGEYSSVVFGSTPISLTRDMGLNIRHASFGIALLQDIGLGGLGDYIDVNNFSSSGTEVTINATLYNDTRVKFFFSAAGD